MPTPRPLPNSRRLVASALFCLALLAAGLLPAPAQSETPADPPDAPSEPPADEPPAEEPPEDEEEPEEPPAEPVPVDPLLGFDAEAVTATGLTPGGEVLVWAVGRRELRYFTRVSHWQETVLADPAGELRYEVSDGVPPASIWVVVDLATGELDVAPVPGFAPPEGPLPPGALRGQGAGRLNRLVSAMEEAQVLLVRPGVGVWSVRLADGGSADVDGANDGRLEAALDALEPAAPSSPAAPDGVEAGDVVVVVDPGSLELLTLRVGPRA